MTSIWDLINIGSFSSLWFWVFLGVFWARVMQAPLGVSVDVVRRAHAGEPQAQADIEALSGMRIRHEQGLVQGTTLVWRLAGWSFVLTLLAGLAALYRVEIAQAVLIIAAPFALVRALEMRAALHMADVPDMAALIRAHWVLRRQIQTLGITAVFAATLFGMLRLLSDYTL